MKQLFPTQSTNEYEEKYSLQSGGIYSSFARLIGNVYNKLFKIID